jgi:shikimate kinase
VAVSRIYLVGFMGAGKTTVGRRLAQKLGWKFIDLDEEIERREGRPVAQIFREDGEPHFRNLERQYLKEVSSFQTVVVALGGGGFIDAQNRDLAEQTGFTIWLKVSFAKLADRVKIDGTRPNFTDTDQAQRLFQMREPYYTFAKLHVSTEDASPDAVVDEIIAVVRGS